MDAKRPLAELQQLPDPRLMFYLFKMKEKVSSIGLLLQLAKLLNLSSPFLVLYWLLFFLKIFLPLKCRRLRLKFITFFSQKKNASFT